MSVLYMTRKVCIIATSALSVYHHRLELINRYHSCGWEVVVFAPYSADAEKLCEIGCVFEDTPMETRGTNPIKDLILLLRIVKLLQRHRPDLVLTFYTKTNIYGGIAARMTRIPYLSNVTGMGSAIENGGLMQRLMLMLYRIAVRKSDCLFFQNEYNLNFFAKHRIRAKSKQLLPGSGVSLERFKALPYPSEDQPIVLTFISRVLKEKGIEEFIGAARKIKEMHPAVRFHVIGPCDNEYKYELDVLDRDEVIRYYGKQFDTRPFVRASHCVVFPSYYSEGMANVLLEGAACGRPLITTGRPGCGETVVDGVTGYVVKERDTDDLIAKIERFISLPYEDKVKMGEAGRNKMEREFDRTIVVDVYLKESEKAMKKTMV